jgi:hypothetical protein
MRKNLSKILFYLLIFFFAANSNSVNGQPNDCKPFDFNLASGYEAGQNTFAYTTADFNLDNNLDIVVINAEIRTVSVLLGDGVGGFASPRVYPTEINPWSITSGDLNSDGKSDLIVASFYENKFALLFNNGDGGFSTPNIFVPPSQFPNQGEFYDLKTADFNGDGNLDVVAVQNQTGKQLKFFLGNGTGGLTLTSTLNVAGNESLIAVGNLNGDNLPDVVVSGGSSSTARYVSFVFGQQSGNFSLSFGFNVIERPVGFRIANFDNVAGNDLAISFEDTTTPTQHFLQPWFNNGSGAFSAGAKINLLYFLPPSEVTSGDFNNDGKIDLATTLSSKIVMVIYGTGNGEFENPRYWSVPSSSSGVIANDLNQDGRTDLATIEKSFARSNTVSVLLNQNNRGFTAPRAVLWGTRIIEAADFNNDGLKDYISAYSTDFVSTSEVVIALNDGNQGLLPDLNFATPRALKDLEVADFNGDGNLDAITAHSNNDRRLAVFLGNGAGSLAAPVTTSLNVPFENIIVGKFNDDNKDDVFAVDETGKGYSMLSNGNGTFAIAPNFPVTLQSGVTKLGKGDFNSDGKLDLIISNGAVVNLWLGNGSGQFTQSPVSIPSLSDVVVGDFNGDENLDLAGFGAEAVVGVAGDGNGGFAPPFSLTTAIYNGRSLISGDFNLDGFDDLAFTISLNNDRNLIIVPGSGPAASWKTPVTYSLGGLDGYSSTIAAADFNNDNKPDIAYNAESSRGIIFNTAGPKPCLSVNDVTITEGDNESVTATFTTRLSAPSQQDVYVNYSLEGQSATIGTDLQNISGRLKIPAGQTSGNISVTVSGDVIDEFDETFIVRLSSPSNAALQKAEALGTIVDNDAEPTLSVTDVTIAEGSSYQSFNFNVTLSATSAKPISFRYSTADGTAVATRDYIPTDRTFNLSPGASSVALGVTVYGDNMYEPAEDFFLNISEPTNVSIADNQAKATLTNDDPVPTVSLSTGTVTEGDSGTMNSSITVHLSNPSYLPVSLNVLTSDGSAVGGRDYVASDTRVTIPAEQQSVTTSVQVIGDTINEPAETFAVNIYNVTNGTIGFPQFQIFILDDEPISNDFDRDGRTDIAVFRPSSGTWHVLFSSNNFLSSSQFGASEDIPVSGDYNGDARTDIGVFRPSNGTWYTPIAGRTQQFGLNGDVPVHGDYDNDGRTDVAVFRPSLRTWFIQLSSNGALRSVQFGFETDKPVPADYDGDGKTDIAVYRPSNGSWYVLRSSDNQFFGMQFGISTDKPVPADYDGDGRADIAVFRDGVWYINRSSNNSLLVFQWGMAGDKPVPGNYDGDEKTDIAIFRNGVWWIWLSTANNYAVRQFGLADDIPIPFVSNN